MRKRIPLAQLELNETASVTELRGGHIMQSRLRALGIRPGVQVTKISGSPVRGPVILQLGQSQTALGLGVSHKVIVEVDR